MATETREPLSTDEVLKLIDVNRSTLYVWIRKRDFPRPAKLGGHSRWDRREVLAWIDARFAERPTANAA
jgi:predicted DNA-binding transcriptional regulator AlpA